MTDIQILHHFTSTGNHMTPRATWWCHDMETFSTVTGGSPHKRWVMWSLMFTMLLARSSCWTNSAIASDLTQDVLTFKWCSHECSRYGYNWLLATQQEKHSSWSTHWGRDKMAAIFQTTFSNAFPWMKMYEFRSKFHWILFPGVQLTIFQHWFR